MFLDQFWDWLSEKSRAESLKIIPNAFGERVLKVMFGALIRAAERWKPIKVTEFERPQLSAVKQELDPEYDARVDLNRKP